jgi:hypothetical protein
MKISVLNLSIIQGYLQQQEREDYTFLSIAAGSSPPMENEAQ